MGTNNVIFLEVLEWLDDTGREMVHRIPERGSGEIKLGAQLTVRESQAAVFFYQGRAYDAFGPGRHTLKTANVPILNKVLSMPWAMTSPLRAEVYFANLKVFTNLKWGTKNPVAFRDNELGLVRLRAFGVYNVRIVQPVLFVNHLVGTQGIYTTADIDEFLGRVIVSRFNDHLGEHLDTLLDLPGRYDELSSGLLRRLEEDFTHYGLALTHLYISSITPPPEVQQAIDDKSRLQVFDDLNSLLKMKSAMAIEKIAGQQGEAGAGVGMGLGVMMPGLFGSMLAGGEAAGPRNEAASGQTCPDCDNVVPSDARFCGFCGHQLVVLRQCGACGKNLPAQARFCSRCGAAQQASAAPAKACPACGEENLPSSLFCNNCGEKLPGNG